MCGHWGRSHGKRVGVPLPTAAMHVKAYALPDIEPQPHTYLTMARLTRPSFCSDCDRHCNAAHCSSSPLRTAERTPCTAEHAASTCSPACTPCIADHTCALDLPGNLSGPRRSDSHIHRDSACVHTPQHPRGAVTPTQAATH